MSEEVISPSSLFPWQLEGFAAITKSTVPHSLLIHGEKDTGKLQFALHLANYIVCESANEKPCLHCDACKWFASANHPDFFALLPEDLHHLLPFQEDTEKLASKDGEDKKQSRFIKIDQIREVIASNERGSYRGGKRVILLYPVEAMQTEAANSLLKTLEEPSSNLVFILVTHQLEKILPTIRSRCRLLSIPKPNLEESLDWLTNQDSCKAISSEKLKQLLLEQGKSPLRVLESLEGKAFSSEAMIQELSKFEKLDTDKVLGLLGSASIGEIVACLQKWCIDLALAKMRLPARYFPSYEPSIQSRVNTVSFVKLDHFQKLVLEQLKLATHPLFPKVQLEALLNKYSQLFRT